MATRATWSLFVTETLPGGARLRVTGPRVLRGLAPRGGAPRVPHAGRQHTAKCDKDDDFVISTCGLTYLDTDQEHIFEHKASDDSCGAV
ncbi:hypothetical protein Pelo_19269 [Pelomyxa schiedti]|nr:hypothetical protein Pelo_19269 [Pelomyxa schiedti]